MSGRVQVVMKHRPDVRQVQLQVDPPENGEAIVNVELALSVPGTASRKLTELSIPASSAIMLARALMKAAPELVNARLPR